VFAAHTSGVNAWDSAVRFLANHHGVIDRTELTHLGVGRGEIARWVAERRLERVAPRVWRLAGSPPTWEQALQAGLLSLGPRAAVSHGAAAALHEFDRWPPGPLDFLVPFELRGARGTGAVHCTRSLGRSDIVTVRGFRTTSATRTIIDLAGARVEPVHLTAAIDSAVRLGLSAPIVITRRLATLGRAGRRGIQALDESLLDAGGHTMLEREFLRLVRAAGLPLPGCQAIFRQGDRTLARVDFLFREQHLVVEVSGSKGHSSPAERARDAQRRNELQDLGFDVYEYTWEQVTQCPDQIVVQLRGLLAA
jgi:very-short-patch-repair endonuclease